MRTRIILGAALLIMVGCEDKAQPDYAKCVQADTAADIEGAWTACNAAIADDPNSKSGKAAAAKLAEMKPKYDAWKADRDAKAAAAAAAQAKADEARRQAEAEADRQRVAALQAKITRRLTGEDDTCVSAGMPPVGIQFTGGTYDENYEVATSKGCVRAHTYYPQQGHTPMDNYFCCPK